MIEQISNKTYIELSNEEKVFLEKLISEYNLSLKQKNAIYISFLFDNMIKESISRIKEY